MSTVPLPILALIALLGLAIGSFLNVLAYRVPRGESIAFPGSHCPRCMTPIKARHNVPVLGWLILRGRCAACVAPISPRYPLVEAGTAALMVAVTIRFGLTGELPAFLFLAAVAMTLALIDIDLRELPDTLVVPAYLVAALLLMPPSAASLGWLPAERAAAGVLALAAVYGALHLACPTRITTGDVKLAGLLGLYLGWLGWGALLVGAVAGLLVGVFAGWTMTAVRPRHRVAALAYGPCMIAGAGSALFVTVPLLQWYGALVGAS